MPRADSIGIELSRPLQERRRLVELSILAEQVA
jgi:hypothetical protein